MKKLYFILPIIIVFFFVTQFWSNSESTALSISEIPTDFVYDGCSMFPDGNYGDCCKTHDDAYFFWGTWQERLVADNELYSCVKDKGWFHHALAPAMWVWVRAGWAPVFPTSYRWGFGRDRYN